MAETSVLDAPVETATDLPPERSLSGWLPRPWLFPLLAIAATWILLIAACLIAQEVFSHPIPAVQYVLYMDARWYARIAQLGYPATLAKAHGHQPPNTAVFFPLYPMAVASVNFLLGGHHVIWAGLVIQALTDAASAVAVWALADRTLGRRVADRSVLLYCAFPGAMVFGSLYTEPLAIALAAGCLLALVSRKWLIAGVLALLAGAAHSTMIVLTPLLGIVAIHAVWTRRDWRSLIAPALAPLGVLAFFTYGAIRYHDFLFWYHLERRDWGEKMDFGAHTLRVLTWQVPRDAHWPVFNVLVIAIFVFAVVGIGLLIASRAPWPITVYTVFVLASVCDSQVGIRPRFILTAVGIFFGYAAKLPTWVFWPLLTVSALALAFYTGYWPHHVHGSFPTP
jgi:hypothetical protein